MHLIEKMLVAERLIVAEAHRVEAAKGSQNVPIIAGVVRNEKVDVLGGPDKTIRDHREASDHDKARFLGDHRRNSDV